VHFESLLSGTITPKIRKNYIWDW